MKNIATYPPLKIVMHSPFHEFASWEELEKIRLTLLELGRCWQESIYLPTWGVSIGVQMLKDVNISANTLFGASIVLATLASWRRLKEVYRFAPELEEILYGQADDCRIPVGILHGLPYSCFYIETPNLCGRKFHGFFVFMDQNMEKTMFILRCLGISSDSSIIKNYDLKLTEETTLEDAVKSNFAEELMNAMTGEKNFTVNDIRQEIEERKFIISRLLQVILYICAQNSDISESKKGRTGIPRNTAVVKDKYREIRTWDVGYRIVNIIKRDVKTEPQHEDVEESDRERPCGMTSRKSPRPHMRKSHWHIYWVGKRNQAERKMVIKWIHSTLINGKSVDELPVTINQYKQENPFN